MERYIQGKKLMLIADSTRRQSKTFKKRRDYFVRLKVHKDKHKQTFIRGILDDENNHIESYQLALEGDNETNYHLQAVIKFKEDKRRLMEEVFRDRLKSWYKDVIAKPKINSYYSLGQLRENPLRALAYNMKEDRHVKTWNVHESDIKIAGMLSHGKDLRQLSKRMEDIKEEYFKTKTRGERTLIKKIILLKAEFNQSIYLNRIEAEARYIMVKKNPQYADDMSRIICERIFGE